jgi:hypothetical protein
MARDSAKNIPYGIHGMEGGIHPFHMEYTGECKDLRMGRNRIPPEFLWNSVRIPLVYLLLIVCLFVTDSLFICY